MKKILIISALFSLGLLSGAGWKAPGVEELPQSKVYPYPLSEARWIWFNVKEIKGGTKAFYRLTLDLKEDVRSAYAYVLMDDQGTMTVNGVKAPFSYPPQPSHLQLKIPRYDLSKVLKKGKNILAFEVFNNLLTGGLFMRGEITLASGKKISLLSNKNVKASPVAGKEWKSAAFDDSKWQNAMEFGDALTAPWASASHILEFGMSPREKELRRACYSKAVKLPAGIAAEKPRRVSVDHSRQAPGIKVGNEVIPPMLHVAGDPFAPGKGDMTVKFARTGIRWCEVQVLDYTAIRAGGYDFSTADSLIRRTLTLAPDTFIGLSIRFSHRNYQWIRNNPDELVQYPTGKADQNNDTLRRKAPSMASLKYRAEMVRFIEAFFAYARKQPWYSRIISCRVSNGCFLEWHYYGMRRDMPDVSAPMTRNFRRFLTGLYKNDAALQQAWHDKNVTLKNAAVPGVAERHGAGNFLRDPASAEKKVMDFYACLQHTVADTLLTLARAVKKEAPHILVGAYYGYAVQMNFPPEGQTILLDKVLGSPCVDFLSAPMCYDSARAPSGDGLKRVIPSVFARHKKLHVVEQDTRTHITYPKHYTAAQSAELFARDTASAWLSGCATQLLSIHGKEGHWMNSPEILSSLYQGLKLWKRLYALPRQQKNNQTAVVMNTDEMYRHGFPTVEKQNLPITLLITEVLHSLHRSGHTYDLLDLPGFLASKAPYKAVIFLNMFTADEKLRASLQKKLHRKGVTAIWQYAPGLVTEKGWSAEAASALTGMKLKLIPGGELAVQGIPFKRKLALSPRLAVDDPRATDKHLYADGSGHTGMAVKKLASGAVSVFSGAPVTDPGVWHQLLKSAGAVPLTPVGKVSIGFGSRVLIPVWKRDTVKVTLPSKAKKVTEVIFNKPLPAGKREFLLQSSGPAVWLVEW